MPCPSFTPRLSLSATLLLFVVLCLNGCVSITGFVPDRSLSAEYDDAGTQTRITSALLKKNATKANDVDVQCFRGHVYLVGEADEEFRAFALSVAREAPEVVHVTTHWFPAGTAETAADDALESLVAEQLDFVRDDPASRLAVDIWGGHAVLTGIVADQGMLNRVVGLTRATAGIRGVTSYLVPDTAITGKR